MEMMRTHIYIINHRELDYNILNKYFWKGLKSFAMFFKAFLLYCSLIEAASHPAVKK